MFLAILASFAVAGITAAHWTAVTGWAVGCVAMVAAMVGDPDLLHHDLGGSARCIGVAAAGRAHAHAELITATRDRDLAEATAHERAQIAGELHDVVSHGLSIVILQSVAARMALHDDADPVPGTDRRLGIVEATARDAPDEMAPSLGLDQVPELVEQGRLAGLDVDLTDDRRGPPLSPGLDAAAYRIAQEAITNVIKHAPGASARVFMHSDSRGSRSVSTATVARPARFRRPAPGAG